MKSTARFCRPELLLQHKMLFLEIICSLRIKEISNEISQKSPRSSAIPPAPNNNQVADSHNPQCGGVWAVGEGEGVSVAPKSSDGASEFVAAA